MQNTSETYHTDFVHRDSLGPMPSEPIAQVCDAPLAADQLNLARSEHRACAPSPRSRPNDLTLRTALPRTHLWARLLPRAYSLTSLVRIACTVSWRCPRRSMGRCARAERTFNRAAPRRGCTLCRVASVHHHLLRIALPDAAAQRDPRLRLVDASAARRAYLHARHPRVSLPVSHRRAARLR